MATSHDHPYGKPENILKFSDDEKVEIDTEILKNMFDHSEVKNRQIVAFSIIGAFRKGKSFFLDYCLRFLYANYKSINFSENPLSNPTDWMGSEDDPLSGFSWRAGSIRDTTGIIVWSDVFLHEVPTTGEKLAIIVMDTQGLFDNKTSPADNSRIFALGTLISSIQVMNLSQLVHEDQLQYLQFATEFAKFAMSDSPAGKPFQNLMFLIRDWANPDEFSFGVSGGKEYMKKFLEVNSKQKEELKSVRMFIESSFEKLSCSLLPHPGKIVAGTSKKKPNQPIYDGNWGAMDEDFKVELETLIEHLLSPERLVMKKINEKTLTGADYFDYVATYFKLFQSEELPKAQSIYDSTVEKQMNSLVDDCFGYYKELNFKTKDLVVTVEHIPIFHETSKNAALDKFKQAKKMGNAKMHEKFESILNGKIEELFEQSKSQTEESIKRVKEEQEKTMKALQEKERAYQEQIRAEKQAAQKLVEMERLKAQNLITEENYKKQREIANLRSKAERERREQIEESKRREEKIRQELQSQINEYKEIEERKIRLKQQRELKNAFQMLKEKRCTLL